MTPHEIEYELSQYKISDAVYEHFICDLWWTEGVTRMADLCSAYWLIDVIASYQDKIAEQGEPELQVWGLQRTGITGVIFCRISPDKKAIIEHRILHTDFPLDSIELQVFKGVLMLLSEFKALTR